MKGSSEEREIKRKECSTKGKEAESSTHALSSTLDRLSDRSNRRELGLKRRNHSNEDGEEGGPHRDGHAATSKRETESQLVASLSLSFLPPSHPLLPTDHLPSAPSSNGYSQLIHPLRKLLHLPPPSPHRTRPPRTRPLRPRSSSQSSSRTPPFCLLLLLVSLLHLFLVVVLSGS